jgi:hypothetical protein
MVLTWSFIDLILEVHHLGQLVEEVDAVAAVVGQARVIVHLLVDVGRLLQVQTFNGYLMQGLQRRPYRA